MNDLPRHEPTPLYPRPGTFEETLRRARRRRQRSAVLATAALVVVFAGGASVALATRGGHHRIDSADINTSVPTLGGGSGNTPSNGGASLPPSSAQTGPGGGRTGPGTLPSTRPTAPPTKPSASGSSKPPSHSGSHQVITGKAVSASGQPLKDIGVYVKAGGKLQKVGETQPDGSYQIPCTNQQVVLASGDFGSAGNAGNQQNYAYTYVTPPGGSCATPSASEQTMGTTVMDTGGQLSVTVTDAAGNPIAGSTEPELYCDATSTAPCYTMVADDAGHYTYSGLATGDYTLRGQYGSHVYHVTAGETTTATWVEAQPSSSPTAPPSSAPPSTPTATPTSDSQSPAGTTPQTQTTPTP